MIKRKILLTAVALLALSAVQLHAAKGLKLAARYNYSPDGQLQSVLTPVSDNGAVKTSYSRNYLSDGKVKVSVHKKNLEFSELAFLPQRHHDTKLNTNESLHDYNEAFASYQVVAKGDIAPAGLDKGLLVREYIEKAGRKLEETDMLGNTSKYYYNNKGQLIRIASLNEGNEVSSGQGHDALVAGRGDRAAFETSFSYDKFGRLDKTEDMLGRVIDRVYDPSGRISEIINPLGEKSNSVYDKYGRLVARGGAGSYPLSFSYNSFGEIVSYADGNGASTGFEYDAAGRLVKRVWADGTPVTYSYNDRGLLSKKLEGGRVTVYSYDNMNRLVKIEITQSNTAGTAMPLSLERSTGVPPATPEPGVGVPVSSGCPAPSSNIGVPPVSSCTLLSYNSSGKLVAISDESGKVEFSYDAFGHVVSEKGSVGTIEYSYNSQGLLSEKTCSFSDSLKSDISDLKFSTKYTYDELDRIVKVSSPAGTYTYSYNKKGQIASLNFGSVKVSYSYDKIGRLTAKKMNDTLLCSYEYDKLDRRVKASVNGVEWIYGYDKFNQLVSAGSSDGKAYSYNFDPIGNRLSDEKTKYAYNKLNQIVNSEILDMKSDAANEKAGKDFIYDAYGNLTKSPGCEYRYDLHNRLCEVRKTDGTIVKYSYDPLGQRVKSEEITTNHTKHTNYLMTGMVELARNVDGETQFHTLGLDLAGSLTKTGCIGAVLASTTGDISFNYLYDANGNVIATCDSSGTIKDKLAYSPFGLPLIDRRSAWEASAKEGEQIDGSQLPFTFSTKAVDASGLVYYGHRFYNPELGRWMSRDPIRERSSGLNLYCFVKNNLNNKYDFKGLHDCGSGYDTTLFGVISVTLPLVSDTTASTSECTWYCRRDIIHTCSYEDSWTYNELEVLGFDVTELGGEIPDWDDVAYAKSWIDAQAETEWCLPF